MNHGVDRAFSGPEPGRPRAAGACRRPVMTRPLPGLLVLSLAACGSGTALVCRTGPERPLPREVIESSGAAWSAQNPDVVWTINDGNDGVLYAVDTTGALVARVETTGARLRDVEDLAIGACGEEHCLYLADTGDNGEVRDSVAIHRLVEPAFDAESAPRTVFPMRFPGGPRDVESVLVLPGERVYLVSKGRTEPPTLYRYPGPLQSDSTVVLEPLNSIGTRPESFTGRMTGASPVPGTDLVLIRSYVSLHLFRLGDAGLESTAGSSLNLRPLDETQGEAVAADATGRVVLTSEGNRISPIPSMRIMRCEFDVQATGG